VRPSPLKPRTLCWVGLVFYKNHEKVTKHKYDNITTADHKIA
jgi:hypothetical protein